MPHQGAPLGILRILLIEDSAEDAELLSDQLLEAGLEARFERVDNEQSLRAALVRFEPDIVLSDLSMPGFSGYRALQVVREYADGMPFVFVSGTMGEETAVLALKDGANDYIIKHNPARLPTAVARAVREERAEIERKRVETELMRAQRLESLALLAAGLSHDLRNILQPLLIVPDLLAGRTDDPRLRQLANVVAECGRRGHEMAESMLSFVRGSSKSREQVLIAGLFQAVQLLLKSSLPDGVRLKLEQDDQELSVEANYTELQQCLLNLSLNALQAMPGGGVLTLAARADGREHALLSVTDTGVGMNDEVLARLFSPFFTTKADGTGLGLISCKRIIESYGGSIEVQSRPGQGACFELRLPLRSGVLLDSEDDTEQDVVPLAGRGQRILLVDGEATRLSLLGNALSSQGYQPSLVADGAAALQYIQQHELPDLVIVDSDIILLSAVSLLLTMQEQGFHGPAIVLEDVGSPLQHDHYPSDIPVHVLYKPLEMRRVFRAVAQALETLETLH